MTSTDKDRIVKACREIYWETSVFYAKMELLLRKPLGYKILYGRPCCAHPPCLSRISRAARKMRSI